jgi:PAS domain S-box-containing protein
LPLIRILLVEDDPVDARLIREYLGEPAESLFHMEWVQNLTHALDRVIEIQPDVILLDFDLPDSQGLETWRRLHLRAPDVPIVVLSGAIDDAGLQAVREGAQDHAVKGQLDAAILARTLRYAVERHNLLRRAQEAELRARGLFEGAADAILVYDVDGRCLDANPAAIDMLGYSADEIRERSIHSFFTEASLSADWMLTHLGRGGEWTGELELLRKDGASVPVEAKVRSVTISRRARV